MKKGSSLLLSAKERENASILVVGWGLEELTRQLVKLQYGSARHVLFHSAALQRIGGEHFSHIIFSVEESDINPIIFAQRVRQLKTPPILIAASQEPDPDKVVEMILAGSRSYLLLPITSSMLDNAIGEATNGQPIDPKILRSPIKNEVLLRNLLNEIDRVASELTMASHLGNSVDSAKIKKDPLHNSSSSLRLFCDGGSGGFVTTLIDICDTLTPRKRGRLSGLRRQLLAKRQKAKSQEEKEE